VRLYTINGADWSKRYPLIVRDAAKIKGSAIVDAEVVWLDPYGMSNFEALHSRANDAKASACAFDLLMRDGDDLRRKPYSERKTILLKALRRSRAGIQYVEHMEGDGADIFKAVCTQGLEGIVSKKLDAHIARIHRKPGSKSKIRSRRRQLALLMERSDQQDVRYRT
jgi:bifunctional non-homologous end joining protein LigD